MKPRIAVRVQHHASRAPLLPVLLERLAGFDDIEVVPDPGGPKPSSWRSHRACLEAVPDDATHLLCVQDDGWPCDDFVARARAVIAAHPHRIVCFFTPGFGHLARKMQQAHSRGHTTVELPVGPFVPVVAIGYPAEVAREIPAYADRRRTPISRADDAVVANYVRAHRLGALATIPSLVEHLEHVPSAMGVRSRPGQRHRVAALFAE